MPATDGVAGLFQIVIVRLRVLLLNQLHASPVHGLDELVALQARAGIIGLVAEPRAPVAKIRAHNEEVGLVFQVGRQDPAVLLLRLRLCRADHDGHHGNAPPRPRAAQSAPRRLSSEQGGRIRHFPTDLRHHFELARGQQLFKHLLIHRQVSHWRLAAPRAAQGGAGQVDVVRRPQNEDAALLAALDPQVLVRKRCRRPTVAEAGVRSNHSAHFGAIGRSLVRRRLQEAGQRVSKPRCVRGVPRAGVLWSPRVSTQALRTSAAPIEHPGGHRCQKKARAEHCRRSVDFRVLRLWPFHWSDILFSANLKSHVIAILYILL
eukprot:scaffold4195_cov250-Pinguiococcus_pyrenoidosus.AAC.4